MSYQLIWNRSRLHFVFLRKCLTENTLCSKYEDQSWRQITDVQYVDLHVPYLLFLFHQNGNMSKFYWKDGPGIEYVLGWTSPFTFTKYYFHENPSCEDLSYYMETDDTKLIVVFACENPLCMATKVISSRHNKSFQPNHPAVWMCVLCHSAAAHMFRSKLHLVPLCYSGPVSTMHT